MTLPGWVFFVARSKNVKLIRVAVCECDDVRTLPRHKAVDTTRNLRIFSEFSIFASSSAEYHNIRIAASAAPKEKLLQTANT